MDAFDIRIGYGEDSHRLVPGRPLVLAGVKVESELGSDAHSDGDVVLHALGDALLSTFALGDIGRLFPPDDEKYKDLPGTDLVRSVLKRVRPVAGRLNVHNVAAVITLDRPKLGPYRNEMESRVASLLGLEPGRVSIAFKTSEGAEESYVQARVTLLVSTES